MSSFNARGWCCLATRTQADAEGDTRTGILWEFTYSFGFFMDEIINAVTNHTTLLVNAGHIYLSSHYWKGW